MDIEYMFISGKRKAFVSRYAAGRNELGKTPEEARNA
jgi:hypothetical protein